jgi:hypothetical protein
LYVCLWPSACAWAYVREAFGWRVHMYVCVRALCVSFGVQTSMFKHGSQCYRIVKSALSFR